MSKEANDIFQAILKDDHDQIISSVQSGLSARYEQELEAQKIRVTAKMFPVQEEVEVELEEGISASEFVKGGNGKVDDGDVEAILGDIYDDSKLTKTMIKTKAYQAGEKDPKGKNPYKKDTVDFHLFQLAQQIEMSRG